MKLLICQGCGLPYGFRSTMEETSANNSKMYKLRQKFKNSKQCSCKKTIEED